MVTVKQLRERLETMPDDYEVIIYPKYSASEVNGYRKHRFRLDRVCEQEPFAASLTDEQRDEYFCKRKYESYDVTNHVAILF